MYKKYEEKSLTLSYHPFLCLCFRSGSGFIHVYVRECALRLHQCRDMKFDIHKRVKCGLVNNSYEFCSQEILLPVRFPTPPSKLSLGTAVCKKGDYKAASSCQSQIANSLPPEVTRHTGRFIYIYQQKTYLPTSL